MCQSPISDKFTKFEEHPKLEINSYTMEFEESQNHKSRTEAFVCEFYKNHTEQVNHLQYQFFGGKTVGTVLNRRLSYQTKLNKRCKYFQSLQD